MSPLTQGVELTSELFPSFIFSFTSGEVCLMTWVKTADTPAQGGRHCSVFHSNSTGQLSFDVSTSLLWWFLFDQSWLSALFHVWCRYCLFAHTPARKHTLQRKQKTLVWLHIWLTFVLFFFTGEAKSTALSFEPSSPSGSMLASVGNSNHLLDTSL